MLEQQPNYSTTRVSFNNNNKAKYLTTDNARQFGPPRNIYSFTRGEIIHDV